MTVLAGNIGLKNVILLNEAIFLQNWGFLHYFLIAGRLILYNVEFWRDNGNCLILGEKCE
jgi:hypothetical protein